MSLYFISPGLTLEFSFGELSTSLPSINQVSHGREINVTHWLTRTNEGGILLTGGEDRKMQVVEVKRRKTTFDWIIHHSFEVHYYSFQGCQFHALIVSNTL